MNTRAASTRLGLILLLLLVAACTGPRGTVTFEPTGLPIGIKMDHTGRWSIVSTSKIPILGLGTIKFEAILDLEEPSEGFHLIIRSPDGEVADLFIISDSEYKYVWTSGSAMSRVDANQMVIEPLTTDTYVWVTQTEDPPPELQKKLLPPALPSTQPPTHTEQEPTNDTVEEEEAATSVRETTEAPGKDNRAIPPGQNSEPSTQENQPERQPELEPEPPPIPTSAPEPPPATRPSQRYVVVADKSAESWEDASEHCRNDGGYLAVISSQAEDQEVYRAVREAGYKSAYFGYSDAKSEGNWTWVNGESGGYENWARGEPNAENPNEDYAMYYWKFSDGSWNDGDFRGGVTAFICEFDLD